VSYLALFQTTLNHECDPSFPAALIACPLPADVVVAVGDVGVLELVDPDVGLVLDAEGDADFVADLVGVAEVGGASRVGVGDEWLGVGCTDWATVVCGAVSRLVPGTLLLACVARKDAVVGRPTFAGAAGEVEPAGVM